MARIRSIKPEMRTSKLVASWPFEVRYFFVLLWGYLDDKGRGRDIPKTIAGDCFPHDEKVTASKVDKWLDLMGQGRNGKEGPICRYEVDGIRYLHSLNWREHQKPNRPTPSRLPACQLHVPLTESSSEELTEPLDEDSVPGAGEQGSRGAGEQGEVETSADEPPPRDDVEQLCERLRERVAANGAKTPSITAKWRTEARLLIDRDGRPIDMALRLVDWATSNSFWKANILSMPKFREKYDQLLMQARREHEQQRAPTGNGHQPFKNPIDQSVYDEELL
jgi:hypothetical protein